SRNRSLSEIAGPGLHSALIAASAREARSSLGAATPTKSPSRTTTTSGIALAAERSTEASVARYVGDRSTLPCHMPGSRMSEAFGGPPVTNERPSTFASEWPAKVHLSAGVVGASSDTDFVSLRPWVNFP